MKDKVCIRCKEPKSLEEFRLREDGKIRRSECKACRLEYSRQWANDNRERLRVQGRKRYAQDASGQRNRQLKYRYGISTDDLEAMAKQQDFRCAVCERRPEKLFVDHNHTTGAVRSLLCLQCNTGLGSFREDTSILSKAAAYLDRWRPAGESVPDPP